MGRIEEGADALSTEAYENQPAEIVLNYNVDHQGSYNDSNPTEPQTNLVQDQYPPQQNPAPYPPPQQPNPAPYPPPQQYPPKSVSPSPSYPPPGSPMKYNQARTSDQPMQFPPPPSQQAHQPYNNGQQAAQYPQNNNIGQQAARYPQAQYNQNQQMGPGYGSSAMPQSPIRPAPGIPMANQFPSPVALVGTNPWKTGLFDCLDDPQNALITACFPCVTYGQIAEIIDNGHTTCATNGMMYGCVAFLIGTPCILSCGYRTKLRSRFGLLESPAPDWVTHCLFEWCALCQEYRELKERGLDPTIGWQGNLARNNMLQQQQQMGMKPPMNQTMNY